MALPRFGAFAEFLNPPAGSRKAIAGRAVIFGTLLAVPLACLGPSVNHPREVFVEVEEMPRLVKGAIAGTDMVLKVRPAAPAERVAEVSSTGGRVSGVSFVRDLNVVDAVAGKLGVQSSRDQIAMANAASGGVAPDLPGLSIPGSSIGMGSGGLSGGTAHGPTSGTTGEGGVTAPVASTASDNSAPGADVNVATMIAGVVASLSGSLPDTTGGDFSSPGIVESPTDGATASGPGPGNGSGGGYTPPGGNPPIGGGSGNPGIGLPPGGGSGVPPGAGSPPSGGGSWPPGSGNPPGGGGSWPPGSGTPPGGGGFPPGSGDPAIVTPGAGGGTPAGPGAGGAPSDPTIVVTIMQPPGGGRVPPVVLPPGIDPPVAGPGPGPGDVWNPPGIGNPSDPKPPVTGGIKPAVLVAAVPEPQTIWLLLAAALALLLTRAFPLRRARSSR